MAGVLEALMPTKVGEGFGRPGGESDLPIDINYAKLIEWLVDRKQLSTDWRKRLRVIQAKAAELPQAPSVGDTLLDFFAIRDTRDRLAAGAERNLLGQLKGDAAEWHRLVGAYEQKGAWLGEAAQTLTRNVDFEIPAVKKASSRAQQQLVDLQRRREEFLQSASAAAAAYMQECKELGIAGRNVDAELRGLDRLLGRQLADAAAACKSGAAAEAVAYYGAFSAYAHNGEGPGEGDADEGAPVPSLRALQSGGALPGADAAGQQDTGRQEPADAQSAAQQDDGAAAGGDGDGGAAAAPAEISWDLDLSELNAAAAAPDGSADAAVQAAAGGISWDIDMAAADGEAAADGAAAAAEAGADETSAADATDADAQPGMDAGVDWDVQIDSAGAGADAGEGDSAMPAAIDWDLSMNDAAAAGPEGAAAGGEAAAGKAAAAAGGSCEVADPQLAALMNSPTARTRLLDDLYELQAFLTQRSAELASGAGEALSAVAPESVQAVGAAAVQQQLAAVGAAIEALSGERLKQLLLIRSSGRHRARLAAHLRQQAAKEAKFKQAAQETEGKRITTQRRLMADAPALAALLERTAMIQREVEKALSDANSRVISVIGEINTLLGAA